MADFVYAGDAGAFKTCLVCDETKCLDDFPKNKTAKHGVKNQCKVCMAANVRLYRRNNPVSAASSAKKWRENNKEAAKASDRAKRERKKEAYRASRKEYYAENRELILIKQKARREENIELYREKDREYALLNRETKRKAAKEWRENNPEQAKQSALAWRTGNPEKLKAIDARRRQKAHYKVGAHVRSLVHRSIVRGTKSDATFKLLGYTRDQLMAHLERQFLPGMTWENYGPVWHIDHIVPLAVHNYEAPHHADFKRAWALSNLRPLWARDNMAKGAKLSAPFQPSLAF